MELDDLKATFQDLNARLDRQNALNLSLLRENRQEKARHGLRPLAWGQALQMAAGALLVLGSASFWWNHRDVPHLLATGLLFHAYGLALILCGVRMQVLLHRVDFGAPVVEIQKQLARLRRFYVVGGLWIGLPWWLLWMPFMAMVFMGLFGVDMYVNAPQMVGINLAVGLTGLLLTWLFHRWAQGRPSLARKLSDSIAGTSLTRVQGLLDEISRFERE
jgi:serine/threonine-protein kinase